MVRRNVYDQPIGDDLPEWQARSTPTGAMYGRLVRLETVDVGRHGESLFQAFAAAPDGRDWTYMSAGPFADRAAFLKHLAAQARSEDPLHYTILSQRDGSALGTAAFMRIDRANGVIEIGHIAFAPAIQRQAGATEAIFLMMNCAFDKFGYRRLEWKCDALNARSRRAADRLGFTFEGLFRQAVVTRGRNRDTAWYAVLDKEWPRVKAALTTWLAPENFDVSGRQIRALAALCEAASGAGA